MSILDVTEEQIFHTLGKGRDPNFKPIEKARPTIAPALKKTYTASVKAPTYSNTVTAPVESIRYVPSPEIEESIIKLTNEVDSLNKSVSGIQSMVRLYLSVFGIAVVIIVGMLVLFMKYS